MKKVMNGWMVFALALIFIGNIGGILIVIIQSASSAKDKDQIIQTTVTTNEILKKQLDVISKEREALKSDLAARDADNKRKAEEILSLNRDLLKKSEKLNSFLGDNEAYPILRIRITQNDKGDRGFAFTVKNTFDYPLYDVEINVFDVTTILQNSKEENGHFTVSEATFKKSILLQKDYVHIIGRGESINPEFFQITDGLLYIKIKSRNTFVFQKMAFTIVQNRVYHGFIVYQEDGTVLQEYYDKDIDTNIKAALQSQFQKIPTHLNLKIE
jgi:hypothetical protein